MPCSTVWASWRRRRRSEEHTSELQSPCNLVCRLLLAKKNYLHDPARARALLPPPAPPRRFAGYHVPINDEDAAQLASPFQPDCPPVGVPPHVTTLPSSGGASLRSSQRMDIRLSRLSGSCSRNCSRSSAGKFGFRRD